MTVKAPAVDRILDAAEAIVLERGASRMTLEAVAARARVSKGGLIYHYPSLRALLEALLRRFMSRMEDHRLRVLARTAPGRAQRVRAFIEAWLTLPPRHRRSAAALLATITREPLLVAAVRRRRREVWEDMVEGADMPERAMILALAVEGLWMSDLLGVSPLSAAERRRVQRALQRLTVEWYSAMPAKDGSTSGNAAAGGRKGRETRKTGAT